MDIFDDSIGDLVAAIIEQAIKDYNWGQKNLKHKRAEKRSEAKRFMVEVPAFFRCLWFKTICNLDGERIIGVLEGGAE